MILFPSSLELRLGVSPPFFPFHPRRKGENFRQIFLFDILSKTPPVILLIKNLLFEAIFWVQSFFSRRVPTGRFLGVKLWGLSPSMGGNPIGIFC